MPKIAGDPLCKVTLNLYDKDITAIREHFGYGWSEKIRELVHDYVVDHLKYTRTEEHG